MRSKREEPAHAPRPTHPTTNRMRWRPLHASFCAAAAVTCAVMLAIGTAGCGTTGGDVAAQTGSAAATTIFDLLITELVNAVADSFDNRPPAARPDDGDNGNGGDDGAYAAKCAGCHGADGSGPPDIRGLSEDDLSAGLQSGVHGSITVSDAELAEIIAFLGGDAGGDNGGNGGEQLDGEALTADNCAACHGADGASGFAPDITGQSADQLATGLESGSHGGVADLSDAEIQAIATFLGG